MLGSINNHTSVSINIKVTVTPNAKKESIIEMDSKSLAICVREKTERNEANKRMLELVAVHFGILPQGVRIMTGHRARSKILTIDL